MGGSDQRRIAVVVAVSAAFHLGLLGLLASQRPAPRGRALPPPILDVTLAPFYLVEPEPRSRRARARLKVAPMKVRRSGPREAALPVAPLYAAPPPGRVGSGAAVGAGEHPAPLPPGTQAQLGLALRHGGVGCDMLDLVGLSRAERDRCLERLGAGAKTATFKSLGLSRDKQAWLDAAAERKQAYVRYRDAPMPPGLSTSDAAGGLTGLGEAPPTAKHPF